MQKLILECDDFKAKNDIIQSVPGVAKVVAFNLLSDMPELGYVTNKEAASLIGVAPFNRESGSFSRQTNDTWWQAKNQDRHVHGHDVCYPMQS